MKVYLLVIVVFFIFYLAFQYKEGFESDNDLYYGYKKSYELNTYCKDNKCIVDGENQKNNIYIKNPTDLLPINISSPFVLNVYNMLKNCKLNSNCFSEMSSVLKENNVEMEPNKDGYLNFICDKDNIKSIKLNRINNEMEKKTNSVEKNDIYTIDTRVEIQNAPYSSSSLNNKTGTVIPFQYGSNSKIAEGKDWWDNNYRILLDKTPTDYTKYIESCINDDSCNSDEGVTYDPKTSEFSITLKPYYLKNISGNWWNPSNKEDLNNKNPDKTYINFDYMYNQLLTMAKSANDDKKEVCKCMGNKMFSHLSKFTINGSSTDANTNKDKLNIEQCN